MFEKVPAKRSKWLESANPCTSREPKTNLVVVQRCVSLVFLHMSGTQYTFYNSFDCAFSFQDPELRR